MYQRLKQVYERFKQGRRRRAAEVIEILKLRYHTFRNILANNETALNVLQSLNGFLNSSDTFQDDLAEAVEELLNVTYELVDGLHRLTGANADAFNKHRGISQQVRNALEALMTKPVHVPRCMRFETLPREAKALVGTKAANLAMLSQAGFSVPDGFAVSARACSRMLTESGADSAIGQRLLHMEREELTAVQLEAQAAWIQDQVRGIVIAPDFSDELRQCYDRLTDGARAPVSVRSSALVEDRLEHSFAGQFDSVLHVVSFDAFLAAFKEVVASNFSARAIAYRLQTGLSLSLQDMAVFCQLMVDARAAGGLFTLDPAQPENQRMLISAVPGLGLSAVGGSAAADLLRPLRESPQSEPYVHWAQIAKKTSRLKGVKGGGLIEQPIAPEKQDQPVVSEQEALSLVRIGHMIETLMGRPQDIEWCLSEQGTLWILQSRDIRLSARNRPAVEAAGGKTLISGGVCASPGRSVGVVCVIESIADVKRWQQTRMPGIMVLHHSLADAAGWLADFEAVVVDLGNPADHLSCIAREYDIPMVTGAGDATGRLKNGQWVIVDADRGTISQAPEALWSTASVLRQKKARPQRGSARTEAPERARLRRLIEPLNLTDAYGPTFSINECQSLHDLIRYVHEKAVLAMFDLGDGVLEEAESLVHRLEGEIPFHFLVIDLGGGLGLEEAGFRIRFEDIVSAPLISFWKGVSTPGLRWHVPPPAPGIGGLFSQSLLDGRSARPLGSQNYALITRDYLNLNARVDFHFAMVDAICGPTPRENYIHFRFKGGGTDATQRDRRARFVASVLRSYRFFTDQKGDLVTASILEARREEIQQRLEMLGRLLGFSRLLDAVMKDDTMPQKIADAFLKEDYELKTLERAAPARL
jgi:pyruvate,water dikinase